MVSYALTVLAAASVALAGTPPGFNPGSGNELIVDFGNVNINGQVVPKNDVQSQPQLATQQKLPGTQFAVIMVDLDIPTNNARQTTTLLHWLQTGLTQEATPSKLGNQNNVFRLVNQANTAADAAYIGPNPPNKAPLSHRYAQILVDTSGVQSQSTNELQTAARTRQGFNVEQVLSQAGLNGKVVAGNFFNVSATGQNNRVEGDDSTLAANVSSPASASMNMPMPTTTNSPATAVAPQLTFLGALAAVAAMFM